MIADPSAAHRYAQAFVTLAHQQQVLDAALADLAAVQQVIGSQPGLARLLANPEFPVEEKRQLVGRLFKTRIAPLALRLVHLLLTKGRLGLLPLLLAEAQQLRDEVEGVTRGFVRTARPLPKPLLERLRERLEGRLGHRVVLVTAVDPALLGGITVQLDNTVLDGSLRRGLQALRERLTTLNVS